MAIPVTFFSPVSARQVAQAKSNPSPRHSSQVRVLFHAKDILRRSRDYIRIAR
jgi:hypothetical protein